MLRKGYFCGRDNDYLGAGVAHVQFSENSSLLGIFALTARGLPRNPVLLPVGAGGAGGADSETAFELFYQAELAPWLHVQPDLQYIASPSAFETDALVVGLRFEIVF